MKYFLILSWLWYLSPAWAQTLPNWQPPRPQRTILTNKLTVISLSRSSSPMVTLSAMVRGGSAADPDSLPGLANFTASLLTNGTVKRSAQQIASEIDFRGARLEADCDQDACYLTLTCLSRDLESLLPLFFEVLTKPSFQKEEIEIVRRQTLSSLQLSQDRPRQVSEQLFDSLLYGDHPYGHPVLGRPPSIQRLSQEHLQRFHQTYFRPNNTCLAVAGSFSSSRFLSLIRRLTADWRPGPVPKTDLPQPPLPASPQAWLLHRPLTQAYITLGFWGPSRQDPDYQAVRLMNYILGGGGFSSRITKSVRVEHGLAYDVDAYFDPRLGPGPYRFTVQTKTATADTAVKLILRHIQRMMADTVSESELRQAKDYILGSYPFRFETNAQIVRQYLMAEIYGQQYDYFALDLKRTAAATARELLFAARRLLRPQNFYLAVVGDTSQLRFDLPGVTIKQQ